MEIKDLSPIFQRNKGKYFVFSHKDKVIHEGILADFISKGFVLKFSLENKNTHLIKIIEFPYPFNITSTAKNELMFDYALSNLTCIKKKELLEFIKDNNKTPSPYYDSQIKIRVSKYIK